MNDWKVAMARLAPGLATLRGYRLDWLRHDLVAGVSVAAVALPMAIAYAELAGFPRKTSQERRHSVDLLRVG